ADPATVQSAGARSPARLLSPAGARPMTPSTARGAALCLLLLCTIQAPAGAQPPPRPLPPALAVSGAAGAAAADTASADALGAVAERAGDHARAWTMAPRSWCTRSPRGPWLRPAAGCSSETGDAAVAAPTACSSCAPKGGG